MKRQTQLLIAAFLVLGLVAPSLAALGGKIHVNVTTAPLAPHATRIVVKATETSAARPGFMLTKPAANAAVRGQIMRKTGPGVADWTLVKDFNGRTDKNGAFQTTFKGGAGKYGVFVKVLNPPKIAGAGNAAFSHLRRLGGFRHR